MRSNDFESTVCSIAEVLDVLGDRWGAILIRDISLGLHRYEDLRRSTGASNATLTDRLRALERKSLITRERYQEHPPRHEYVLTPHGEDLHIVLIAMAGVGDKWKAERGHSVPLEFVNGKSGESVELTIVDSASGAPVARESLRTRVGPGADDMMKWRLTLGTKASIA